MRLHWTLLLFPALLVLLAACNGFDADSVDEQTPPELTEIDRGLAEILVDRYPEACRDEDAAEEALLDQFPRYLEEARADKIALIRDVCEERDMWGATPVPD